MGTLWALEAIPVTGREPATEKSWSTAAPRMAAALCVSACMRRDACTTTSLQGASTNNHHRTKTAGTVKSRHFRDVPGHAHMHPCIGQDWAKCPPCPPSLRLPQLTRRCCCSAGVVAAIATRVQRPSASQPGHATSLPMLLARVCACVWSVRAHAGICRVLHPTAYKATQRSVHRGTRHTCIPKIGCQSPHPPLHPHTQTHRRNGRQAINPQSPHMRCGPVDVNSRIHACACHPGWGSCKAWAPASAMHTCNHRPTTASPTDYPPKRGLQAATG